MQFGQRSIKFWISQQATGEGHCTNRTLRSAVCGLRSVGRLCSRGEGDKNTSYFCGLSRKIPKISSQILSRYLGRTSTSICPLGYRFLFRRYNRFPREFRKISRRNPNLAAVSAVCWSPVGEKETRIPLAIADLAERYLKNSSQLLSRYLGRTSICPSGYRFLFRRLRTVLFSSMLQRPSILHLSVRVSL